MEERRQTGWSVQLGRVAGIPIRIHFTFLLLLVWFAYRNTQAGSDLVLSVVFLLIVFTCVVLHELGHALMARVFGVPTRDIVLYPIGGIARLEKIPAGQAELMIALAGPAVNLILAALLVVGIVVAGTSLGWEGRLESGSDLLIGLCVVNLLLFLFNLIPAFPMDGGRVLRAILSILISQERATEIATAVGQGASILFGVAGIVTSNPLLLLIALFVFIGASQEALLFRQRSLVEGVSVRDAMIVRIDTLAPQDTLDKAAGLLLTTHQQDFPVVDAWGRISGVLPRASLLQGLAREGGSVAILEVMRREVPVIAPDDGLSRALELMRSNPGCPVMVVEAGRLVGMLTLENVARFIQVARRKS